MQHQTARYQAPLPEPAELAAELTMLCRSLAGLCGTAARRALRPGEWDYLITGVTELSGRVRQHGFHVADSAARIAEMDAEIAELRAALAAQMPRRPPRARRGQGQLWPAPVPRS